MSHIATQNTQPMWIFALKKLFEIQGVAMDVAMARNLTLEIARKGNFIQFIAIIQESA